MVSLISTSKAGSYANSLMMQIVGAGQPAAVSVVQ
jgi:hypothetical protein